MDAKTPIKSEWDGLDKEQIRVKVRENSIARFYECEAARTGAVDAGKPDDEAFSAAKAIWNGWADGILARRKVLEDTGAWHLDEESNEYLSGDYAGSALKHDGPMLDWILDSTSDFSCCCFSAVEKPTEAEILEDKNSENIKSILVEYGATNWLDFKFPATAGFSNTRFTGIAYFSGAKFTATASFSNASFPGTANFSNACFSGTARFSAANFSDAYFSDVTFSEATFTGRANFFSATFTQAANFFRVVVKERANMDFEDVIFGKTGDASKSVDFGEARFEGPVKFKNTVFHGPTSFRSMRSEVSFRLEKTKFDLLPDFREVRIEHRPELDGMSVKDPFLTETIGDDDPRNPEAQPPCWWRLLSLLPGISLSRMAYAPDPETVPKYRAIRGLAMQANGHEQEMDAFAGELRAQRFREHSPFDFSKGMAGRFWLGFFYQHVSNFGRSFWRPLGLWAGLTMLSFLAHLIAYLPGPTLGLARAIGAKSTFNVNWPPAPKFPYSENPFEAFRQGAGYSIETVWAVASATFTATHQWVMSWTAMPCQSGAEGIGPIISAATLSVKNALLFLGGISIERSRQASMCLFGRWDEVTGDVVPHGAGLNPAHNYQFEPLIPWYISTLSSVQTLLSIILFFLFLLAVRNHFKIHD